MTYDCIHIVFIIYLFSFLLLCSLALPAAALIKKVLKKFARQIICRKFTENVNYYYYFCLSAFILSPSGRAGASFTLSMPFVRYRTIYGREINEMHGNNERRRKAAQHYTHFPHSRRLPASEI